MSGSFNVETGRMYIVKDGRVVFDTGARPPELLPANTVILNNYDIEFPDLWKGTYYRQGRDTGPVGDRYTCLTCAAPINQEWGPSQPSPNTLSDIAIATVPALTNYIDVFATVSQVVTPSPMFGSQPINTFFPQGAPMHLDGGSLITEWMGPLRRVFSIFLSGTTVYLRRQQSMTITKSEPFIKSRNTDQIGSSTGNREYFFSGTNAPYALEGPPGSTDPNVFPNPAYTLGTFLDGKGPSGGSNHRPGRYGGQDPCSEDMSGVSYRSVYRANLTIVPGRI